MAGGAAARRSRAYNRALNIDDSAGSGDLGKRLESWKEIAAYLNRSERTVRRWEEREGLPVHRLQHDKRGSIFAYAGELDAWRNSRRPPEGDAEEATASAVGHPALFRRWAWPAGALVLVAAAALFWVVPRHEAPAARAPNPEAVRAVAQASFAENAGRAQIQNGVRHCQDAVRLDPEFANAWNCLAMAHIAQTWFGEVPARDTMTLAKSEAQRALELDPTSGSPWRELAFASHYLDWDHEGALRQIRRALELNPRDGAAANWAAEVSLDMRRFNEAFEYNRRAQELSPRWLTAVVVGGNIYLFTGHVDLAIAQYRRALETEPNHGLANHFLGRAYLVERQYEKAVAQFRRSNELLGEVPFSVGDLGYALAVSGHRDEAGRLLARFTRERARGYYPAFPMAEIELGLGHVDACLDWLERAADERHLGYYMPSVDPLYDPLRSSPRFKALLRRVRLDAS